MELIESAMKELVKETNDPFDKHQIPLTVPSWEDICSLSKEAQYAALKVAKAYLKDNAKTPYEALYELVTELQ